MCGRYAQHTEVQQLGLQFGIHGPLPNARASWNVAPTNRVPVVRFNPDTRVRQLDLLQWGLVPRWAKDPKSVRQPINARAETIATSPMFRDSFRTRRCIVPADAYYEWRAEESGKQPYAIARVDGTPMAVAGIWDGWKSPDGEVVRTYAIITTDANQGLAHIHDRMPVVLEPADWPMWLGEADGAPADLLHPSAEGVLHSWRVGRAVGSVRNDGPALLAPA